MTKEKRPASILIMRLQLLAIALITPFLVACPKPRVWWHMAVGTRDTHEDVSLLEDGETTLHYHDRYRHPSARSKPRTKWGFGRIEEGQLVGPWTLFHVNGNIKAKTSFENGQMNGVTSFHWQHGGVCSLGMMEDGKRVGEWQEWKYDETNPARTGE